MDISLSQVSISAGEKAPLPTELSTVPERSADLPRGPGSYQFHPMSVGRAVGTLWTKKIRKYKRCQCAGS